MAKVEKTLEDEEEISRPEDGEEEPAAPEEDLHLEEPLSDESGVEEALEAWAEGGHAADLDEADEIAPVQFAQLEQGVPKVQAKPSRLNNVVVDIAVELGRKDMTVGELANLKEQDVIELDKLAGEAFDIRVNGRLFAKGEVVVVTDLMAVRITSLEAPPEVRAVGE